MTFNERKVLDAIEAFVAKNRYSPTLHELASATHLSRNAVQSIVGRLAEAGRVRRRPGCTRSVEPRTRSAWEELESVFEGTTGWDVIDRLMPR